MLVITAIISSLIAFISGIAVIGRGHHWQYETSDLVRGRVNAWLYVWVTLSTILSLGHFMQLLDYGLTYDFAYRSSDSGRWMVFHTAFGFMFTTAHVGIRRFLSNGHGDQYMWGSRRAY